MFKKCSHFRPFLQLPGARWNWTTEIGLLVNFDGLLSVTADKIWAGLIFYTRLPQSYVDGQNQKPPFTLLEIYNNLTSWHYYCYNVYRLKVMWKFYGNLCFYWFIVVRIQSSSVYKMLWVYFLHFEGEESLLSDFICILSFCHLISYKNCVIYFFF